MLINKIAILGILLIILVLVIVFLIIGVRSIFCERSVIKYNAPVVKYNAPIVKYGGGDATRYGGGDATRYDTHIRQIDYLKKLFMKDIKSMMMYFDRGRFSVVLDYDDSCDNNTNNKHSNIKNKRIISYNFDTDVNGNLINKNILLLNHGDVNSIFEQEPHIDYTDASNPYNPYNADIYDTAYDADQDYRFCMTVCHNKSVERLPLTNIANPFLLYRNIAYFKTDGDIYSYDPPELANKTDDYANAYETRQVGIVSFFDKVNQSIDNIKTNFEEIATLCAKYLKNNNDDYLLNTIKTITLITNDNKSDSKDIISKNIKIEIDCNSNDLSILSEDIIDIIAYSKHSLELRVILYNIIELINTKYYENNAERIKVYINIFCEILKAGKGKLPEQDINFIMNLYDIYFGDPMNNIIAHKKMTSIILHTLQTYELKSGITKEQLMQYIFGYYPDDNFGYNICGINYESLFNVYQNYIYADSSGKLSDDDVAEINKINKKKFNSSKIIIDEINTGRGASKLYANTKTIDDNILNLHVFLYHASTTMYYPFDGFIDYLNQHYDTTVINDMLKMDIYDFKKNCKLYMELYYTIFDYDKDNQSDTVHEYCIGIDNKKNYILLSYESLKQVKPIFFYTNFIFERIKLNGDLNVGHVYNIKAYASSAFFKNRQNLLYIANSCINLLPHLIFNQFINQLKYLQKFTFLDTDIDIIFEKIISIYKFDKSKNLYLLKIALKDQNIGTTFRDIIYFNNSINIKTSNTIKSLRADNYNYIIKNDERIISGDFIDNTIFFTTDMIYKIEEGGDKYDNIYNYVLANIKYQNMHYLFEIPSIQYANNPSDTTKLEKNLYTKICSILDKANIKINKHPEIISYFVDAINNKTITDNNQLQIALIEIIYTYIYGLHTFDEKITTSYNKFIYGTKDADDKASDKIDVAAHNSNPDSNKLNQLKINKNIRYNGLMNKLFKITGKSDLNNAPIASTIIFNGNNINTLPEFINQIKTNILNNFSSMSELDKYIQMAGYLYCNDSENWKEVFSNRKKYDTFINKQHADEAIFCQTLNSYYYDIKIYMKNIVDDIDFSNINNLDIFTPIEKGIEPFFKNKKLNGIYSTKVKGKGKRKGKKAMSDIDISINFIKEIDVFYKCVGVYVFLYNNHTTMKYIDLYKTIKKYVDMEETNYTRFGVIKDEKTISFTDIIDNMNSEANGNINIIPQNLLLLYNIYTYWELNIGIYDGVRTDGSRILFRDYRSLSRIAASDKTNLAHLKCSGGGRILTNNKNYNDALSYILYVMPEKWQDDILKIFNKINMNSFYNNFLIYNEYNQKFVSVPNLFNDIGNGNNMYTFDDNNIISMNIFGSISYEALVEQNIIEPYSVYHRLTKILTQILARVKLSNKYENPLDLTELKHFFESSDLKPDLDTTVNIVISDVKIPYISKKRKKYNKMDISISQYDPMGASYLTDKKNNLVKSDMDKIVDELYKAAQSIKKSGGGEYGYNYSSYGVDYDEDSDADGSENQSYQEMLINLKKTYSSNGYKFTELMSKYRKELNKLNWVCSERKICDAYNTLVIKNKRNNIFDIQKVSNENHIVNYFPEKYIESSARKKNLTISLKHNANASLDESLYDNNILCKYTLISDIYHFKNIDECLDTYGDLDGKLTISLNDGQSRYGRCGDQLISITYNQGDGNVIIEDTNNNTIGILAANYNVVDNIFEIGGHTIVLLSVLQNNDFFRLSIELVGFNYVLNDYQKNDSSINTIQYVLGMGSIKIEIADNNNIINDEYILFWGKTLYIGVFDIKIVFSITDINYSGDTFNLIEYYIESPIDYILNEKGNPVTHQEYFMSTMQTVQNVIGELQLPRLNYFAEKNYILGQIVKSIKGITTRVYTPRPPRKAWYDDIDEGLFYQYIPFSVNQNEFVLTELQQKIQHNPDMPINIIANVKDKIKGLNFRPAPKSRFNPKKHKLEDILERLKKGLDVFEGSYWFVDDNYASTKEELIIGQ